DRGAMDDVGNAARRCRRERCVVAQVAPGPGDAATVRIDADCSRGAGALGGGFGIAARREPEDEIGPRAEHAPCRQTSDIAARAREENATHGIASKPGQAAGSLPWTSRIMWIHRSTPKARQAEWAGAPARAMSKARPKWSWCRLAEATARSPRKTNSV